MGAKTSKRKQQNDHKPVGVANLTCNHSIDGMEIKQEQIGHSGVYYYFVDPDTEKENSPPPPWVAARRHQNMKHSTENLKEMADEIEEKMLIANILREENLRAKGRAAREFNERQAKVLKRKAQMSEEKVQKVQDKLNMDEIRLLNRPKISRPKFSARTTAHLMASKSNNAENIKLNFILNEPMISSKCKRTT